MYDYRSSKKNLKKVDEEEQPSPDTKETEEQEPVVDNKIVEPVAVPTLNQEIDRATQLESTIADSHVTLPEPGEVPDRQSIPKVSR